MTLKRIDPILENWGPVWGASGLQGLDGKGWDHSWLLRLMGLDLTGVTMVTKTTTTDYREGYTPFRTDTLRPTRLFPRSVIVDPFGCHTLNAWGLSGPGAAVVLERLVTQEITRNFQISYMPVGTITTTREERLDQTRRFVAILKEKLPRFPPWLKIAIQFNVSCPNTGHELDGLLAETREHLAILKQTGLVVIVKGSVDILFEAMLEIAEDDNCDAIEESNTVKFGNLSQHIPWKKLYGTDDPKKSPLALRGFAPGGYSGPYLLPLVVERVRAYRKAGMHKHLNAGSAGSERDARQLREAGADSISIGTIANYRPWRVKHIVREAYSWYSKKAA
jgi:dihydroorotate dehydrogenase